MQKIIVTSILILWFGANAYCQNSMSVGFRQTPFYSSLGKFMNEDHLINDGTNPVHDTRTYLRYGLGIDYMIQSSEILFHQVQATVGHRYIKEKYENVQFVSGTNDVSGWIEETEYNQVTYVLSYLLGGKYEFGRFIFSGGLGGSLLRIGKGYQSWYSNNYYEPEGFEGWYEITDQKITTGGGWGIGVLSQFEVGIKINEKLIVSASVNNYFTFLMFVEKDKFRGTYDSNPGNIFPDSSWDTEAENKHYRLDASRIAPAFKLNFLL